MDEGEDDDVDVWVGADCREGYGGGLVGLAVVDGHVGRGYGVEGVAGGGRGDAFRSGRGGAERGASAVR